MPSANACRLEDQGGLLTRGDIGAGPEVGQDKTVGGHSRQSRSFSKKLGGRRGASPPGEMEKPSEFQDTSIHSFSLLCILWGIKLAASLGCQLWKL